MVKRLTHAIAPLSILSPSSHSVTLCIPQGICTGLRCMFCCVKPCISTVCVSLSVNLLRVFTPRCETECSSRPRARLPVVVRPAWRGGNFLAQPTNRQTAGPLLPPNVPVFKADVSVGADMPLHPPLRRPRQDVVHCNTAKQCGTDLWELSAGFVCTPITAVLRLTASK